MTDNSEKLAGDLKTIALTPQERQVMRGKLQALTQLHRPRTGAGAYLIRYAATYSTLALFAMTSVAVGAAGRAMPGDVLYPVRLAVNDRVAVAMAGDETTRMEREIEQLERTINEEELVAVDALAQLIVGSEEDERDELAATDTFRRDESDQSEVTEPENAAAEVELDLELDTELNGELRALQRLLDDEESALEVELTL